MSDPNERCELLPCPFCGASGVSEIKPHYIRDGQSLGCTKCGASVRAYNPNALDKCIAAWNTRSEQRWRPIETLEPRFGAVLGWADGCGFEVIRCFSDGHRETAGGFNEGWATHWQPLPEPPHPNEEQN